MPKALKYRFGKDTVRTKNTGVIPPSHNPNLQEKKKIYYNETCTDNSTIVSYGVTGLSDLGKITIKK